MVSGELEKSLRAELKQYLSSRLSELQEEITRLQSQVNESFTRVLERSRGEVETDTSVTATISQHIRAAYEHGIEAAAAESTRTKASSDMAILKAGIDEISEQHSQTEILTALVNRAASFAPRIAFFVIKNEQAVGWRARGLEGSVGDDAVAVAVAWKLGDRLRNFLHHPVCVPGWPVELLGLERLREIDSSPGNLKCGDTSLGLQRLSARLIYPSWTSLLADG